MDILQQNSPQMDMALDIFNKHAFATVIVNQQNGELPYVCHLPMHYEHQSQQFFCHSAARNPLNALIAEGNNQIMLVFIGQQGYDSPMANTMNSTKTLVPTWNYDVIHVVGRAQFIDQPQQKYQSMQTQVIGQESQREPGDQWQIEQLDDAVLQDKFSRIKVIRIDVESMKYRYKNR